MVTVRDKSLEWFRLEQEVKDAEIESLTQDVIDRDFDIIALKEAINRLRAERDG